MKSEITRNFKASILERLGQFPGVVLTGPRQVGKTTLALQIAEEVPSVYLDLENPRDRQKLEEPELYLSQHADKLVILDEIQRVPELFPVLRGIIDRGRRAGVRAGRFLFLGSASFELLRQSSESLAGRVAYLELPPLLLSEVGQISEVGRDRDEALWVRGGFPESYLAPNDEASFVWREQFIRTYLERDIPSFGLRLPTDTIRRLWTMLAHNQGQLFSAAPVARNLSIDNKTVARYIDLLVDLLLIRRLPAWHGNVGKRLVKSPRLFVRDSGALHALLGVPDREALLGHPVQGASFEGFVLEHVMAVAPPRVAAYFYRSAAGAEIDLVLELPSGARWAIEIKRSLRPTLGKGFWSAHETLKPERSFVVYAGEERYPVAERVEAISILDMMRELSKQPGSGPQRDMNA